MKLKVILILTLCLIISTDAYAAGKKAKPTCGATSFNDCPTEGCGGDLALSSINGLLLKRKCAKHVIRAAYVVTVVVTDEQIVNLRNAELLEI